VSAATGRVDLHRAFIVAQVALSLTLLVVSSLCLRSHLRIVGIGVTPRHLHRELLRHASRLVGVGIALSVAAPLLVTPALGTFLVELSPADPVAFVPGAAMLMLVAFIASYLPGGRVARVDPLPALRE
jgi:hypothetical protein